MVTLEEAMRGGIRAISLRPQCRLPRLQWNEASKDASPAPHAKAQGRVSVTETHKGFKIPAGVRDGQRLRISGRGEPGTGGGPPGDLYLRVRLASHPDFRVEGGNLYYDLDLAPWEAALGT